MWISYVNRCAIWEIGWIKLSMISDSSSHSSRIQWPMKWLNYATDCQFKCRFLTISHFNRSVCSIHLRIFIDLHNGIHHSIMQMVAKRWFEMRLVWSLDNDTIYSITQCVIYYGFYVTLKTLPTLMIVSVLLTIPIKAHPFLSNNCIIIHKLIRRHCCTMCYWLSWSIYQVLKRTNLLLHPYLTKFGNW